MNWARVAMAGFAGFVFYFVFGGLCFKLVPSLKDAFSKFPSVYRSQEGIKSVMPVGMAAMLMAILVLAVLYAMSYQGGSGLAEGARFGALIGLFAVGSFVVHNYVNLNIDAGLTIQQSIVYFVQWVLVGVVIGAIYRK